MLCVARTFLFRLAASATDRPAAFECTKIVLLDQTEKYKCGKSERTDIFIGYQPIGYGEILLSLQSVFKESGDEIYNMYLCPAARSGRAAVGGRTSERSGYKDYRNQ